MKGFKMANLDRLKQKLDERAANYQLIANEEQDLSLLKAKLEAKADSFGMSDHNIEPQEQQDKIQQQEGFILLSHVESQDSEE